MHSKEVLIDAERKLIYAWFPAMFTRVDIALIDGKESEKYIDLLKKIQKIIEKTELIANRFDDESELTFINNSASIQPLSISTELFQMIESCIKYHKLTLGLFDITVNSKNGYNQGMQNIALNSKNQSIQFLHADIQIDLSGFIKGYVLNEVRDFLQKEGFENALINMGNSSILAMGNHPYGNGWKVSVADALETKEILLQNQCLTTSGNKKDTVWPVIHPQTGEVIVRSKNISVVTHGPALGEVLSTALYLANNDETKLILNELNGEIINRNYTK